MSVFTVEQVITDLRDFVGPVNIFGKPKKMPAFDAADSETALYQDLDIAGDDVDELIDFFEGKYGIQLDYDEITSHFPSEGKLLTPFTSSRRLKAKFPKFTVQMLADRLNMISRQP